MATELLYLKSIKSGYFTDFNANVSSVEKDQVTLNRKLFYPLGGGQNWDTGTLEGPNGRVFVHEVRGRGNILHTIDSDHQLEVGDEVKGAVDWKRRHAHMRMHTAQHLVSGVVYEAFNGARTVGNQIHDDRSRIDFNPISFTEEML
jgi:misacylated tRNA(Ala) deacylase